MLLVEQQSFVKISTASHTKQYAVVFDALPQAVLQLLKGTVRITAVPENCNCDIFVGG